MDELDPAYLDGTDLEAVRIETELDIRDAYVALMNRDSYPISRFYAHHTDGDQAGPVPAAL